MSGKQNKPEKKLTKSLRNVLLLPKKIIWPVLPEKENQELQDLLKKTLKLAAARNVNKDNEENIAFKEFRKELRIGVNDVARGIEKKILACCLVAGEVKPKILVSHIVSAAEFAKVPLIVLRDLKKCCHESLGFPSMALGLKKTILQDNKHMLFELCSLIIRFSRMLKSGKTSIDEEEECDKKEIASKPSSSSWLETSKTTMNFSDIYLYRDSNSYRVFHPDDTNDEVDESETRIILDSSFENWNTERITKRVRYFETPTIARVQSNPNKRRKNKK